MQPAASQSQSQSSGRSSKRSRKARVTTIEGGGGGAVQSQADAAAASTAVAAADGAATAIPAPAPAAASLSRVALLRSLPHAVSRRHPLAFHHCLRHALPALQSHAANLAVASPLLSRSPRPRRAGLEEQIESADASFLTQPLSEPTLGIRSLLFARTRPLLAVASAECVFVWRGPTALRVDSAGPSSEAAAAAAAAASLQSAGHENGKSNGPMWTCAAILPVAALPAPVMSIGSTDRAAGDLPCPFTACRCFDATRLPRQSVAVRSTSADGSPVQRAVFVCLSHDESVLYIAVNRQVPCMGAGIGAESGAAIATAALSSPASVNGGSQSPWLHSLLNSPPPRSSNANANGASGASPRVAASSPHVSKKGSPAPLAGSQGIETAFDALFADIDEPTPTASASMAMTQQLPAKEPDRTGEAVSLTAPSAASPAAGTQPSPQQRKSGGRKPKRKFTGPAAKTPYAAVAMRPSFEVYELRLDALDAAPSSSPERSPISTPAKPAQPPTATAASAGADDDVDVMMADLLGQVNKNISSPPPRAQGKPLAAACDHLRFLFSTTAAVTALLPCGEDGLLVGDAAGNVGVWARNGGGSRWTPQRSLACPRASAIVSLSLASACDDDGRADQQQVLVAVHQNADVQVWDVERGVRVRAISARVHAQPAPPPPSAPVPLSDAEQAHGAGHAATRDSFVVSPTTSTPASSSPLRSTSSQQAPPTPLGADGSLLIPETPSREILSEAFLSPRQEDGEHMVDTADGDGALDASVCVHAAVPVVVDDSSSQLRLMLLVSAPQSLGFHSSSAASELASPSQPAPRKSSRKRGASSAATFPPAPCPASLPSVVSLHLDLSDAARTAPLLGTRNFPVPLLLSDDNPSVHATCIGSSNVRAEEVAEKQRLIASLCSDSDAPLPPPMIACGLSSGAMLLHSASSARLLAIMSDGGQDGEEQMDGSQMQLSETDNSAAGAGTRGAVCEGGAVTFASAYDENQRALSGGLQLSSSPASVGLSPLLSSPAPTSSQRSPRSRTTAAAGRARKGVSTISSSPPPSSACRAVDERVIGSSSCPSSLAASSSRHVCTRAITAIAFHPLYHSIMAVGDQQGHVHLYTATD